MRRVFSVLVVLLAIEGMWTGSAFAVLSGSIALDSVEGNFRNDSLGLGPVTFHIRYTTDLSDQNLRGFSNGFRVHSPDGALWAPLTGEMDPAFVAFFDLSSGMLTFGVDGSGSDTIAFFGIQFTTGGWPTGSTGAVLEISTVFGQDALDKTICLDSAYFPPNGRWLWSGSGNSVFPNWDGPHCFPVSACIGDPTDSDGDGVPNICDACPSDPDNDSDGDGLCAGDDNCPLVFNPTQTDSDNDGAGDLCDDCPLDRENDRDHDGLCADVDNCPKAFNPLQEDEDEDGIGDVCDFPYICGDADGSQSVDIADIVFIINYFFFGGPAPVVSEALDVNSNGDVSISDLIYLIEYMFYLGDPPSCQQ